MLNQSITSWIVISLVLLAIILLLLAAISFYMARKTGRYINDDFKQARKTNPLDNSKELEDYVELPNPFQHKLHQEWVIPLDTVAFGKSISGDLIDLLDLLLPQIGQSYQVSRSKPAENCLVTYTVRYRNVEKCLFTISLSLSAPEILSVSCDIDEYWFPMYQLEQEKIENIIAYLRHYEKKDVILPEGPWFIVLKIPLEEFEIKMKEEVIDYNRTNTIKMIKEGEDVLVYDVYHNIGNKYMCTITAQKVNTYTQISVKQSTENSADSFLGFLAISMRYDIYRNPIEIDGEIPSKLEPFTPGYWSVEERPSKPQGEKNINASAIVSPAQIIDEPILTWPQNEDVQSDLNDTMSNTPPSAKRGSKRSKASNADTFHKIEKLAMYRADCIKMGKPIPTRTQACASIQPRIDAETARRRAPELWRRWDDPTYTWESSDYVENIDTD